MTPEEYHEKTKAFVAGIGASVEVLTTMTTKFERENLIGASLYLNRKNNSFASEFSVYAGDFAALFERLQEKWVEHRDRAREKVTEGLALAIIRLTSQHGACTDAALRQEFDDIDIKQYGEDACVLADAMAEKGPFQIVRIGRPNNQDGES